MAVRLFYNVVVSLMRWLFHEATTSFSLLAHPPQHHKKSYMALRERPMGPLTCTNVLALMFFLLNVAFSS
jgi:hypothetical protein